MSDFLEIHRGDAPLIVSMPHTGTEIPPDIESRLVSPWLGRKDTDWWVDKLYDFAPALGATTIRTRISRTAIDANRDPSGASLYPGMTTTGLCPTETFDGEPLYRNGQMPDQAEIETRKERYFLPYHHAIETEIARLKKSHAKVMLFDAHSIRSEIPRLFEGRLPDLNIGTNDGRSCDWNFHKSLDAATLGDFERVFNGRFKGGWTTRHYGQPAENIHAVQLELACRSYLREPVGKVDETNWPVEYEAGYASNLRAVLTRVLKACISFASETRHDAH